MKRKTKKDIEVQKQINKVVKWLKRKNYDVVFHHYLEDQMSETEREVFISSRYSKETQLFGILHECGHLLLRQHDKHKKLFPAVINYDETYHHKNKQALSTKGYIIDFIHEEILAWDEGEKLSKRLKLKLDKDKYKKDKYKYVFRHLKTRMVQRKKVFGFFFDKKNG